MCARERESVCVCVRVCVCGKKYACVWFFFISIINIIIYNIPNLIVLMNIDITNITNKNDQRKLLLTHTHTEMGT